MELGGTVHADAVAGIHGHGRYAEHGAEKPHRRDSSEKGSV